MKWASMRKAEYLGTIGVIFFIFAGIPLIAFLLKENPTCYDNKQNQNEVGIDCGGVCERLRLCESQIHAVKILWSRSFRVSDGTYNSVAYIENPNFDGAVREVEYVFTLYDDKNVTVAERRGKTFLSNNAVTPIFEAGLATGNRVPARTFFEFVDPPRWVRATNIEGVSIEGKGIREGGLRPKIDATLVNESLDEIKGIEIIATVFDANNNAIASSRTTVDSINARSKVPIVFTWPNPFSASVARIDVIPRIPLVK